MYRAPHGAVRTEYVGPAPAPTAPAGPEPHGPAAPLIPPVLPATGPVEVGVSDATLAALQNNEAFRVERLGPSIAATFVDELRAAFDPVFSADFTISRSTSTRVFGTGLLASTLKMMTGDVSLTEFLPTGTTVALILTGTKSRPIPGGPLGSTRVGLTVTQSLLQGFGLDVNLASLRQARIDVETSQYVLRGFAEALVAQVEESYWDYRLAQMEIDIFARSEQLAEDQLKQTEEMIRIGRLAKTEVVSAQAEVALRKQDLIGSRTALETARLSLVRLINPQGDGPWGRQIVLKDKPAMGDDDLGDVEPHVALALRMRPDLNEARLQVQRGDLEVVKTKNGLLPLLDAFITLGKSGYASTFGRSLNDVGEGPGKDISGGFTFQVPIGNRAPTARNRRAVLNLKEAKTAVDNMAQLVQVDVRSAFVTVANAREQVVATTATRALQEQKVQVEQEKFRVGRSTTLLVAQAQRDLLASQISEVQAIVAYMKALTGAVPPGGLAAGAARHRCAGRRAGGRLRPAPVVGRQDAEESSQGVGNEWYAEMARPNRHRRPAGRLLEAGAPRAGRAEAGRARARRGMRPEARAGAGVGSWLRGGVCDGEREVARGRRRAGRPLQGGAGRQAGGPALHARLAALPGVPGPD